MRIAWFAPFGQGGPLPELVVGVATAFAAAGHEPVIFRLDLGSGEPNHSTDFEVRSWRDWRQAVSCALSLHSFGDDFAAYAAAYDILARRPGLAILHDPSLGRYFADLSAASGSEGTMTPEALIGREALGVVAATATQRDRLAACCSGPVAHLPPPQSHEPTQAYAAELLALCRQVLAVSPLTLATHRVGVRLAQMGVTPGDALVRRLAQAASALFPTTTQLLDRAQPTGEESFELAPGSSAP